MSCSRADLARFLGKTGVEQLARIAVTASHAIMQIYDSPGRWGVGLKSDDSPLTQADVQANEIILAALGQMSADIPVLSEESAWQSGEVSTYWAVDPLDGTKEFIKRNGEFTVNIALVINGQARLGVICAPVSRTVWAGVLGDGQPWAGKLELLSLNASEMDSCTWIPISVDSGLSLNTMASPLRLLASRSHGGQEMPHWMRQLVKNAHVIERGSSLKFCLIAQGDADLYVRLGPTSIWDIAAGHAILNAAGGKVVDLESLIEMRYESPADVLNPNFIAYSPRRFTPHL